MSKAWRNAVFCPQNTEADFANCQNENNKYNDRQCERAEIVSVLEYIEGMTLSLSEFALRNDEGWLAHLLHVAGDEARAQAQRVGQNSKPRNAPFN